jgi:Tfp pilus assembly protein PilO
MKLEGKTKNAVILSMLGIAALAVVFWMLALSPKREEAKKLGARVGQLKTSLSQHRAEVEAGLAARRSFAVDYQRLVVLGKAAPSGDDTPSLLVQINRIANKAKVRFQALKLEAGSGSGEAPEASISATGEPVSATEASASLLPLGASIGPAGLAVMPYTLTFQGGFFKIAAFIEGLDELVKSTNENVAVDGRLITIDGFSLEEDPESAFPKLQGTFKITTFVTPPGQGLTGGATPAGPGASSSIPASTTTGGAP